MSLHIFINELKGLLPKGSLLSRVLKIVLLLVALACFLGLEVYIYLALDRQLKDFSSFGSGDFLLLFLFVYFFLSVLASLPLADRCLYRKLDEEILSPLPVSDDDVILGKGLYLYVRLVVSTLFLATPLLIAYGTTSNMMPQYYVLAVLYPFVVSFVAIGLLLALLPLYHRLARFMKGKFLLQLVLGAGVTVALCFLYQYVLELFLSIVQGSRLDSFFSASFLSGLHEAAPWFIPVSNYFALMSGGDKVISNLLYLLGAILLMAFLGIYLLTYLYRSNKEAIAEEKKKKREKKAALRVLSPFKALLKKEFILLFRNGSYLFSFSSLLFMQPFLSYVVIASLSKLLYSNLAIFLKYFSELPNGISLLLLLLFASLVSSGAADGITREEKGRLFLKTSPLSPFKMTLAKLLLPLGVSLFSFYLSAIVLVATGEIGVPLFFVALVSGTFLVASVSSYGLLGDLASYSARAKGKGFFGSLTAIVSIAFPLLIALVHFALMFYSGLPSLVIYLVEVAFSFLLLLPLPFVPRRLDRLYLEMEAGV